MDFRDALNATMERYNIIAERLAEKAGITTFTISAYRNAKQGTTVGVLEKILDALTEEQRRFLLSQAYPIEYQEVETLLNRMDDLDTKVLLRVLDKVTRALIQRQKAESSNFLSTPMLPVALEQGAGQSQPELKKMQNPAEPALSSVATRVKKTGSSKSMLSIAVPETAFSRIGEILIEWVDLSRAIRNEEWVVQRFEDQTLLLLKAEAALIQLDRQPPRLSLLAEANDFIIKLRQLFWEVAQDPSRKNSKPAKQWLILLDRATMELKPADATVFLRFLFDL